MQRLKRVSSERKKEDDNPNKKTKVSTRETVCLNRLNRNILYLILRHKFDFLNLMSEYIKDDIKIEYSSFKDDYKRIHIKNERVFKDNFNRYKKLEIVELEFLDKLYLLSFNYIDIIEVSLKNVGLINYDGITNSKVFKLKLISMKFNLNDFTNLLIFFKPSELILINIDITDQKELLNEKFFNVFLSLNLLSFQCYDSFLDYGFFSRYVIKSGIRDFYYRDKKVNIFFQTRGPYIKLCSGNKEIMFLEKNRFKEIEFLQITDPTVLEDIMHHLVNLKYLEIVNIKIDDGFVSRLKPINNLFIKDCSFDKTSFYKLVWKVSKTVKKIFFKQTELPLNGQEFLTKVQIKSDNRFEFFI